MAMHENKSREETKENNSKEFIEMVRLTREEQIEWFSFVVEKDEIEIAQHIKGNKSTIAALMHFTSTYGCTCSLDFETCLPSENCSKDEVIENLRTAITGGVCPHTQSSTSTKNLKPSGIYWIHLAIITGKRNLIKIVLPYLSNFEVRTFVFYTLIHKISPLDLSLLHNDIELATLFLECNDKQFSNCVLNIYSDKTVTAAICKNVNAMKLLWPYFDSSCDRIRECWEKLLKICHEYGYSPSASFLHSNGINLAIDSLRVQLLSAISTEDIERVQICLSGFNASKLFVDGLYEATHLGNNEIVSLILEKIRPEEEELCNIRLLPCCMINAVFSHNIQVIRTLIKSGIDVNTEYCGVSLLSWTKMLGLKIIEITLTKAGGRSYNTYEELYKSPLTDLVYLEANTLNNVKLLVEQGYNPNGRHDSTISAPVYAALNMKKFDVLEYLLFQGADLYLNSGALYEFYANFKPIENYDDWMKFLKVLVKTNVMFDSCANEIIMWNLVGDKKCEKLFEIILKTSHSFSRSDTALFRKWEKRELPSTSGTMITWWLHDVKSLQESCRNSLRRHYGHTFYNFTQKIESEIPTKILKYIRCEDITGQYLQADSKSDNRKEFRSVLQRTFMAHVKLCQLFG